MASGLVAHSGLDAGARNREIPRLIKRAQKIKVKAILILICDDAIFKGEALRLKVAIELLIAHLQG